MGWEILVAELQNCHDKDWTTTTDAGGTINGAKLDSVFYTFKVDHYWRGCMKLMVVNKIEDNWKEEVIYSRTAAELKKYRRPVDNDELKKAKDIARLVRRFERIGDDSQFISAYGKNQNLQMIIADLFTHVSSDGIELQSRSDGICAKIFKDIHLNYIMSGSAPVLKIYLYPKQLGNYSTADKIECSSRVLQDAARFAQLGYDLSYFTAEFGLSSQSGKIQMDRHNDISNFTEIYEHIKTSESGRQIIKKFMTDKMGKK